MPARFRHRVATDATGRSKQKVAWGQYAYRGSDGSDLRRRRSLGEIFRQSDANRNSDCTPVGAHFIF
jgi:hypothetical protein